MNIENTHETLAFTKSIVLIGMMGVGKTHIGRLLSQSLNLHFVDSDALIEEKAGCSIQDIFARDGESKFRQVEAATIRELLNEEPQVIATGGGAILNPETWNTIKDKSVSIWIDAPFDHIWMRVSKNQNRPLLACENPQDVLKDLIERRTPLYKRADIHVENLEGATKDVIHDIMDQLSRL